MKTADSFNTLIQTAQPVATAVRRVMIIDRPCGTGKTTHMIDGFDPTKRYLVVTPLLSECERIIAGASVPFRQPEVTQDDPDIETKKDHLIDLLEARQNVVTTHAMFDNLSDVAEMGLIDTYHVVIDEVMTVAEDTYRIKQKSWDEIYVGHGYVTVDPETGRVIPTDLWESGVDDVDDTLNPRIFKAAKSGRLYHLKSGINLAVMPEVLLKAGRSLTIYTYKAEGSMMAAYLRKIGLDPEHDKGDPAVERKFVREARELITIRDIPALRGLKLSHTGQTSTDSAMLNVEVPKALRSLRQNSLRDEALGNILTTCPKGKWYHNEKAPRFDEDGKEATPFRPGPYAKGSRLAPSTRNADRAIWVPNTTRGTNDYKHCTTAIYLYDQHINPAILNWFGGEGVISKDDYALTELIQWVWRTRVRDRKPITLYIPSKRMRDLLLDWLWEGDVPTAVRNEIARRR